MGKGLAIMAIITVVLIAYALTTVRVPPASVEYREVFYTNNQSVTFVTKDGVGLFTMVINPRVDSFELTIEFPKGTSYLVKYGDRDYRGGTDEFKVKVERGGKVPDNVYVNFQLPQDLTRKLVFENGEARITVRGDKEPIWHGEDVIYVSYRKEGGEKS